MNRTFKAAVAALILAVSFAGSVAAGPFEDAAAAYIKGDYATALRLMRPLAEQGNAIAQFNLGQMYRNGGFCPAQGSDPTPACPAGPSSPANPVTLKNRTPSWHAHRHPKI
jgi:hypothetical protein